jgi:Recombinase
MVRLNILRGSVMAKPHHRLQESFALPADVSGPKFWSGRAAGRWGEPKPGIRLGESPLRSFWNKRQRTGGHRRVRRSADEWVEIPVPAIITEDIFHAVQAQLARNQALAILRSNRPTSRASSATSGSGPSAARERLC